MAARSWIRKLFDRKPYTIRKDVVDSGPRLEGLEDRCVPSTLVVTNPADDVNVPHTLRYNIAHAASSNTVLITPALHGKPIVLTHGGSS